MSDIVQRLRNWADPSKSRDARDTDDMAIEAADWIERLTAALLICRNHATYAMSIDPNDPLAITVESIAEGRMGPLAAEAAGGSDV